ncbi:hypothetical protein [Pontibacillus halophilus]
MERRNCFQCKHFYTTWNPAFPRGCKAYGFKGRELPSVVVHHATGEPCKAFEVKGKASGSVQEKGGRTSSFDFRL